MSIAGQGETPGAGVPDSTVTDPIDPRPGPLPGIPERLIADLRTDRRVYAPKDSVVVEYRVAQFRMILRGFFMLTPAGPMHYFHLQSTFAIWASWPGEADGHPNEYIDRWRRVTSRIGRIRCGFLFVRGRAER